MPGKHAWLISKWDRSQILLAADVHEDMARVASVQISSIESNLIDTLLQRSDADTEEKVQPCWKPIPWAADEVSSYERLQAKLELGKFQASIGSTDASGSEFLVNGNNSTTPMT
jgi:hypothetical protein